MKNLFDLAAYPLPVAKGQCCGCDSGGAEWSIRLANQFTEITGLIWPDVTFIELPLKKDCHVLGIVDHKWDAERALTTPVRKMSRKT